MSKDKCLLILGVSLCTVGLCVFICGAFGVAGDILAALIVGLTQWGAGAFCIGLHIGREGVDHAAQ